MKCKFLVTVIILYSIPNISVASDFSPLLVILHGVTLFVGVVIFLFLFALAKNLKHLFSRIAARCAAISICFTPVSIQGGNGEFQGLALGAIISSLFGGDIKYLHYGLACMVISFLLITFISFLITLNEKRLNNRD